MQTQFVQKTRVFFLYPFHILPCVYNCQQWKVSLGLVTSMSFFSFLGNSIRSLLRTTARGHTHTTTLFNFDMSTSDFLFLLIQKQLSIFFSPFFVFVLFKYVVYRVDRLLFVHTPQENSCVRQVYKKKTEQKGKTKRYDLNIACMAFLKKKTNKLVLWYFSFKISISSISSSTSCLVVTTIRTWLSSFGKKKQ